MDGSFDTIKDLYDIWRDGSEKKNRTECTHLIEQDKFFFWVLIPSAVIVIILMFSVKRLQLWPNVLFGRPGILIPMDFLEDRGIRLSCAAVYGLTSSLCLKMILQEYPIKVNGPIYITVFVKLGTMMVYGFALYPLLANLTTGTVLSLAMGTLYAWLFFIITVIRVINCSWQWDWRFYLEMVFLPSIPELVCSSFLAISIPWKMVRLILQKRTKEEEKSFFDDSYQAEYVRHLFRKRPKWCHEEHESEKEFKERVRGKIKTMAYGEVTGFRFSPRILSTYSTGVILLFLVAYLVWSFAVTLMQYFLDPFWIYIEASNDTRTLFEVYDNVSSFTEDPLVGFVRIVHHWLYTGLVIICLALSLASFVGLVQVVLGLRAYREDLLSAHRGNFSKAGIGNSSLMRAFVCYSGYQVAYIFWAFILQTFTILLVLAILSYLILIPTIYNNSTWFIALIRDSWPAALVSLAIYVGLQILSGSLFLQHHGKVLAINNRRLLFCSMYFLFFYNIFVGFFSCLMRMGNAVVVGLFYLSRLDSSTLPKKFENMDPGFEAYVGLITVENAHTHPVLVTFVHMVKEAIRTRRERERVEERRLLEFSNMETDNLINRDELGSIERMANGADTDQTNFSKDIRNRVRARWYLAYTLLNNLPLRATRKHYIDAERERQRRRFRKAGVESEVEIIQPNVPATERNGSTGVLSRQTSINEASTQYLTF